MKLLVPLIGLTLLVGAAGPVRADTVKMPLGQQPTSEEDVPRMGMKKTEVERQYGSPRGRKTPVGDPPISRWDYSNYSVYFEGNTVLHTVQRHRQAKSEE